MQICNCLQKHFQIIHSFKSSSKIENNEMIMSYNKLIKSYPVKPLTMLEYLSIARSSQPQRRGLPVVTPYSPPLSSRSLPLSFKVPQKINNMTLEYNPNANLTEVLPLELERKFLIKYLLICQISSLKIWEKINILELKIYAF